MSYKIVDEMPESGQFVCIWTYGGVVWSDTFRYSGDGYLEKYDDLGDCFIEEGATISHRFEDVKYVLLTEEGK